VGTYYNVNVTNFGIVILTLCALHMSVLLCASLHFSEEVHIHTDGFCDAVGRLVTYMNCGQTAHPPMVTTEH